MSGTVWNKKSSKLTEINDNFIPPPTEPRTERYNEKPSKKIDIDKYQIQDGQVINGK